VAAAAVLTITAGLVPFAATAANATSSVTVTTYAGPTRYETSASIAEAKYPNGVTSGHVILATGSNFPDALAANYLAGQLGAPILLTPSSASDPEFSTVTGALSKLLNTTAKNVTIVGGTSAVGADVMAALQGDGYTVNQIGGATRFDTAQLLDTQSGDKAGAGVTGNPTAILATGDNFPDALAGGPLAWAKHFPVILTDGSQTTLSPQAQATLSADGIKNVLIMGGSAAINPGINTQLTGLGITIDKQFAGVDRTDTAAQLAAYEQSTYGFSTAQVILASGGNFPDALSAGPLGGDPKSIYLTEPDLTLGTYTTNAFKALGATATSLVVVGGSAAVPTATVTAAQTALQTAVTAQTLLPQLQSASLVTTVGINQSTSGQAAGSVVQYVFSAPLTGAVFNAASFKVWQSDASANYAGAQVCFVTQNCSAVTSFPASNAVDILFTNVPLQTSGTADSASTLTLATVVGCGPVSCGADAVVPAVKLTSGLTNPDGQAAIGSSSTTALTPNTTSAPDLTGVGTIRTAAITPTAGAPAFCTAAAACSAIDLNFDKPAYPQAAGATDTANFNLVFFAGVTPQGGQITNASGQEENCTGPGATAATGAGLTVPGYNAGSNTVTIICANASGSLSSNITTAQIARIVVLAGGVGTQPAGQANDIVAPTEATPTPHTTASPSPSLTTVTITPGTGSALDTLVYNLDTGVGTPPPGGTGNIVTGGGHFFFINQNGSTSAAFVTPTCGTTTPSTIPGGDNAVCQVTSGASTTVIAFYFPQRTLATAVGAGITPGAITNVNVPVSNADDELGASNTSTTTQSSGAINAVQLASATATVGTNAIGSTTLSVVWTFDFSIDAPGANVTNTAGQHLAVYSSDGTELICATAPVVGVGTLDDTATCGSFNQAGTGGVPATGAQLGSISLATIDAGVVVGNPAAGTSKPAPNGNGNPEGAVSA
jgi:putative cell wall-binding protein